MPFRQLPFASPFFCQPHPFPCDCRSVFWTHKRSRFGASGPVLPPGDELRLRRLSSSPQLCHVLCRGEGSTLRHIAPFELVFTSETATIGPCYASPHLRRAADGAGVDCVGDRPVPRVVDRRVEHKTDWGLFSKRGPHELTLFPRTLEKVGKRCALDCATNSRII